MDELFSFSFPLQLDLLHVALIITDVIVTIFFLTFFMRVKKRHAEIAAKLSPLEPNLEDSKEKTIQGKVVEASHGVIAISQDATQIIALFQKEARLVDFFSQSIEGVSDADVASAARVIHAGGQKVFKDYIHIEPIRSEEEESNITVQAGFNPQEVRLVGRVTGSAPFKGVLVHRGWRVKKMTLPQVVSGVVSGNECHVIAPAEVEI